ncbi:EamA family transporter [Agrobacterium vitis]|uniref:DMT family transporter n=1 Tax=Agrobacterium vitis TaxID=373 RepID=UPI000872AEAE|nr:DMT family transporter [Agrobacterium vitis]MCE6078517.1 EamA family transporter [Agrobacterium vitis]MCF1455941.1 DMT family transporter [Agrobacterium vitis]MCF1470225.1 DMT family transporter [Agrobacterium vitis]MUO73522.1 EamA family transporter [Agrobacterium vitis]MUO87669.1 EamA family transporter [Agrobacterium vitis]
MSTITKVASVDSTHSKGLAWMVLSTILFVCVDAVIKQAGETVHPFEIGFFRNVFGFIFLLPALYRGSFQAMRTSRLHMHFLRGIVGLGATLTFFYALTVVPLVEVISISFAIPIFAVVLAALILRERPSLSQWALIFMGFVGALIIIRPGYVPLSFGTVIVVISALLNAFVYIIVKRLSRTDSSLSISAWMCVSVGTLSLPFAAYNWTWPTLYEYGLMALIGILATSAQYAIAEAFRNADASAMMPAEFLKLIWAAIIGYIVFSETVSFWVYFGAFVIILANMLSAIEKRRYTQ